MIFLGAVSYTHLDVYKRQNQQFVVMDNEKLKKLKEKVAVGFWEKYDDTHTVIRFATSWSTTEEDLKALEQILRNM